MLKASEGTMDKRVKAYRQGIELQPGYVYLCCCRKECYSELPWKSKQVYQKFEVRIGDSVSDFLHVVVGKKEWYAWLQYEGTLLKAETARGIDIAEDDDEENFPSMFDDGVELIVSLAVLLTAEGSEKLGVTTPEAPPVQREVKTPPPLPKKQTIEWQRARLLRSLSRLLARKLIEERKKQRTPVLRSVQKRQTIEWQRARLIRVLRSLPEKKLKAERRTQKDEARKQKTMENYARVDAERQKRQIVKQTGEDPNIDTYEYDLIIRVVGAVMVFNRGLRLELRLKTGRYLARKCSDGTHTYLMMRDPSGERKIEYGLQLGQWLALRRDSTVTIEGL